MKKEKKMGMIVSAEKYNLINKGLCSFSFISGIIDFNGDLYE